MQHNVLLILRSFLFRGIGHTSNPENELVANVLKGDAGAVSEVPGGGVPSLFGSAIQLVSAVQARCVRYCGGE